MEKLSYEEFKDQHVNIVQEEDANVDDILRITGLSPENIQEMVNDAIKQEYQDYLEGTGQWKNKISTL